MPFREIPGFSSNNQGGAACSLCGQHARILPFDGGRRARTYATGVDIHMEGPLEVCEWCLYEGGLAIGMQPEAVVHALKVGLEELTKQAEEAEAELEAKTSGLELLARELADAEDRGAAKAAAAYDRGWRDAEHAALIKPDEEPDFAGTGT